ASRERKEDGARKEKVKKFTWLDSAKVLQRHYCLAAERGRGTLVQSANIGPKEGYFSPLIRKFTLLYGSPLQPRLHIAWIFLSFQVNVGLGMDAIVVSSVWSDDYGGNKRGLLPSKIVFFLGLHEIMLHWGRTVVRPVVDDTIFGDARSEKWIEKVAISAAFGALWLWRLRDEVEMLVLIVEIKRELLIGLGVSDFIGWWLYYFTVTIGVMRVVKGFIWFAKSLFCRRPQQSNNCSCEEDCKDQHLLPISYSIPPSSNCC
ncbi:hypothetical protein MKW98_011531, partial [Papaver atlanticum]